MAHRKTNRKSAEENCRRNTTCQKFFGIFNLAPSFQTAWHLVFTRAGQPSVLRTLSLHRRQYPGCSSWAYSSLKLAQLFQPSPDMAVGSGLHIVLFEACLSVSLALRPAHSRLSPIRDTLIEGFSHFVTSMTCSDRFPAGAVAGWELAPTGKAPSFARRTPKKAAIGHAYPLESSR